MPIGRILQYSRFKVETGRVNEGMFQKVTEMLQLISGPCGPGFCIHCFCSS